MSAREDELRLEALDKVDALFETWWQTAERHGFHEDLEDLTFLAARAGDHPASDDRVDELRSLVISLFVSQKLKLAGDELAEAHEEVRSGNLRRGIYWKCKKCGCERARGSDEHRAEIETYAGRCASGSGFEVCGGELKPEGFEVELADVIIRVGDLAKIAEKEFPSPHTVADALAVKSEYNKSRPYKHGRGF